MGYILYTLSISVQTHTYLYIFIYFDFKGFHSKTRRPFEKKVANLIKYISVEKVLVFNKNKVLNRLNICPNIRSHLKSLFCFGPGAIPFVFLFCF